MASHLFPAKFALLRSTSDKQLADMMYEESKKLLEIRKELIRVIEAVSEDYITNRCFEVETHLAEIKAMRNGYQNEVEDFIDMYLEVSKNPEELDKWMLEVKEIGLVVKKHAKQIRSRAFHISASAQPPETPPLSTAMHSKPPVILVSEKAEACTWLSGVLKAAG